MHVDVHSFSDTIVALSTPPGVGALGVIRVSGSAAIELTGRIFKGKNLQDQPGYTLHYGRIADEADHILDEVIVALFRSPHSFTGEDIVEISCHGSPYILQQVLQLLVRTGARLAKPGEFTQRAFLHGKMDLAQAEAVADLIASTHQSAHEVALRQMRGGISRQILALREELIHFASLIELELDFSEEDVEFANRDQLRGLIQRILGTIRHLSESFQLGNAMKEGVNTVLAGRPNAGKSTLLNALLEEERAIVSEIAGTTRDTIEESLTIQGIRFRLIDTAGIREAQDQIEAIGVSRTMEKIRESAILIYVFDVLETSAEEIAGDLQKLARDGLTILLAPNKMDLNPYTKPEDYISEWVDASHIIPISAKNAQNIPYLKEKLYATALAGARPEDDVLVSNARHAEALYRAGGALEAALNGLDTGLTGDLLAEDIRQALYHLGEITGQVTTDDLLANIFGKFCIGK
ncbi:MAG: tRNA uridine-5-carboxymethylaminomethyl(34) synthesis GTPase MnmE [Saprospiraceae bacterium]|nr:tRNA uridine-5-carboxymethylaminomethyl(34) synthesis GTPase MnmE [Saprospiraceae bacterium]